MKVCNGKSILLFFPPYNIEKVDILIDFMHMKIFLIDFFFVNLICAHTSIPNNFKTLNAIYFKSVVINHFKGLVKLLMYNLINYYSSVHIIVKHTFNALAIVYCTNV